MQRDSRINLIYIVSNGRSGSTLLDLLLGAHPNMWTLGEFQVLPWELLTPIQTCGCGQSVTDCLFWQNILDRFDKTLKTGTIHRFRRTHGAGRVLRWSELARLFSGYCRPSTRTAIRAYGLENALIMREVLKIAKELKEVNFLVDASKDPYRLWWLLQSDLFSVHVIHLTKDPRAFVYSMTKYNLADYRKAFRMSLRYIVQNRIIELILRKTTSQRYVQIRYEDPASRPKETMHTIFTRFGISSKDYNPEDFRKAENHAISGNKMRHDDRGIFLDEMWRRRLPASRQYLIKAITYLTARRYGYS